MRSTVIKISNLMTTETITLNRKCINHQRLEMKISKPEYLEKVRLLNDDEQQRVLSRMSGKLPNRLLKEKLSVEEAIAIQLEIEDEQLAEWRKNWAKIRKHEAEKTAKAEKKQAAQKDAAARELKASKTVKTGSKPASVKTAAKVESVAKPAPAAKTTSVVKAKPAKKPGKV